MSRASFFEPLTRIDVVSGQKEVDWCNERDNCDDQGEKVSASPFVRKVFIPR